MIEKEHRKGASKTADFLQRKPQEEVLEPKPSTVSPDEEKLSVGISTIGLQAKRLSGAQKKKLIRERKMKEGTWTEEKPKRKTPPSQEKGKAGNSGGVKRPHSESSTPSQEMQQPKKPRSTQVQTGTRKEAAVGIKMAIVHRIHPDVHLDQAQTDNPGETTEPGRCKPFGRGTSAISILQICTGSVMDHLCKLTHKGLANANSQRTWRTL